MCGRFLFYALKTVYVLLEVSIKSTMYVVVAYKISKGQIQFIITQCENWQ